MSSVLKTQIKGSLGNEGPDGFRVFFVTERVNTVELGTDVFFTPDQFRKFWHDAGEELRKFDEMAGAPSSEEGE